MLTAEKNRLQQALPPVRHKVAEHIAWLEQALKEWERELDQLLHSVPGVGPTVSRTVLAHWPELGQGSVKHIATLVVLAPLNRDSSTWRGTRSI